MTTIADRIQALIEEEVRIQINKYARVISKRHDISLKLLLSDLEGILSDSEQIEVPRKSGQCFGITGKGEQCKSMGKNQGYCVRHLTQKKQIIKVPSTVDIGTPVLSLNDCVLLEKERQKKLPSLLISI